MVCRIYVVKVGEKERGFVGSELSQKLLGQSGKFFFSLFNVGGGLLMMLLFGMVSRCC